MSFACTRNWVGNTLLCTRPSGSPKSGASPRQHYPQGPLGWTYVKGEQAGYNRLAPLEYGGGVAQQDPRSKPGCNCLVPVLAILLGSIIGVVIREMDLHVSDLQVSGIVAKPTTTLPLYDCSDKGDEDWGPSASMARLNWCCENFQQGCAGRDRQQAQRAAGWVRKEPFECSGEPQEEWGAKRRRWCCENKGLGCPTTRAPEQRLNCSDLPPGGRSAWPAAKKQACQDAFQLPIYASPSDPPPGSVEVTSNTVDSNQALVTVQQGEGRDVGTRTSASSTAEVDDTVQTQEGEVSATAPPAGFLHNGEEIAAPRKTQDDSYDCGDDKEHWMAEWSPTKKAWCCRHTQFACPPDPLRLK